MKHLIINWLVSAGILLVVSYFVRGFIVTGFISALFAAALIGLANITIKPIFGFFLFPITFITFGLFSIVINAIVLKIVAAFSPGFKIKGFIPALVGAVLITIGTWFAGLFY